MVLLIKSIKLCLFRATHERPPTAEEIAKELDMTINDVKESMKNSGRHVSMDAPLVEGEDSNLYDVFVVVSLQIQIEIYYTNLYVLKLNVL